MQYDVNTINRHPTRDYFAMSQNTDHQLTTLQIIGGSFSNLDTQRRTNIGRAALFHPSGDYVYFGVNTPAYYGNNWAAPTVGLSLSVSSTSLGAGCFALGINHTGTAIVVGSFETEFVVGYGINSSGNTVNIGNPFPTVDKVTNLVNDISFN